MGKKTFTADLSVSGLNALKKQLLQYRDDLPIKCKQLVSSLLQSGVEVAETNISESPLGKYVTVSTNISADKMGCNGILLAIEFGAGVHFNPTKNPLVGSKFPYGVGTFPGQTHAYDDMWWYWNEKEQKWMPTHGVKATMPMYKAGKDIRSKIIKTAKEIF